MEMVEMDDGELVGVTARNTWFIKFYGITEEEFQDTSELIRKLFKGKGYLYLREANRMFREKLNELNNEQLIAENQALKQKLEEKEAIRVPKTLGK